MIIHTAKNSYLIIGYIKKETQSELCLCENTENHRRCLMIRIMDLDLIYGSAGFLYEQAGNRNFTDFEECTVDEQDLLAIFTYPQGQILEEKLSGEYTGIAERLDIVRNILERFILQNVPAYFAARCMRPGGVWIKRSGEVSFLYDVTGAERGTDFGIREVSAALCSLQERLFSEELKRETVPELKKFLMELQEDSFSDYMELYRRFQEVRQALLELSQETLTMPKTWIFRAWDRVKSFFKPVKKLAAVVLLVVVLVYMMWTIQTASQPAVSMDLLEKIGTLDIP